MKFSVIFERTTTGWSAYPPDLPGVGAAAKTLEETRKLIEEAIKFHIEGLREDGEPMPEPSTIADYVNVTV